jgi:hypothetical protein
MSRHTRPIRTGLTVTLDLVLSSLSLSSFPLSYARTLPRFTSAKLSRSDEPHGYRPSGPLISCALRTDHCAARGNFRQSVTSIVVNREIQYDGQRLSRE